MAWRYMLSRAKLLIHAYSVGGNERYWLAGSNFHALASAGISGMAAYEALAMAAAFPRFAAGEGAAKA